VFDGMRRKQVLVRITGEYGQGIWRYLVSRYIVSYTETVKLSLIQLSAFAAAWKRLGLTDADLRALEVAIARSPAGSPVMAGTGGLRKIRLAAGQSRGGKSGGLRVCYVHFPRYGLVYLCAVYPKNDKANLTAAERAAYRKVIEEFDRYLRQWFEKGRTP
jgi:hypothetical protein